MCEVDGYPIPLLDDDLRIVCTVPFVDNLTLSHVPDYVNQNGYMGLSVHDGQFVIMYYDKLCPNRSYAEYVTPKEAYTECLNRGKLDVAYALGLKVEKREVEVL